MKSELITLILNSVALGCVIMSIPLNLHDFWVLLILCISVIILGITIKISIDEILEKIDKEVEVEMWKNGGHP